VNFDVTRCMGVAPYDVVREEVLPCGATNQSSDALPMAKFSTLGDRNEGPGPVKRAAAGGDCTTRSTYRQRGMTVERSVYREHHIASLGSAMTARITESLRRTLQFGAFSDA
jgi:hypothetical protein